MSNAKASTAMSKDARLDLATAQRRLLGRVVGRWGEGLDGRRDGGREGGTEGVWYEEVR